MNETIFGSATPVWTAMPSIGLAYQPMSVSNRPIAAPLFSSTAIPGGIGGALTGAGLSTQQNLAGSGYVAPYAFAPNPTTALPGHDSNGLVTASSLLMAVAQRRGQPQGPVNDHEVEEFIYDALDLLPGTADVEVRSENGRVTLTGVVQHKRTKRDIGEIAWALPGLQDVQNNVSITSRRRGRAGREAEAPASASARKQG
jgi:BON domain-containing protein